MFLSKSVQAATDVFNIPDIKACEIVTGKEVAEFAGGKMPVAPGSNSFFCNYTIEMQDGRAESNQLVFDSPSSSQLLLQHITADQKGVPVDGILDEAYLGKDSMGSQLELRALRAGKFGMNIIGEREDVILKIARLAVTRLK